MCAVSMIYDHYNTKWHEHFIPPNPLHTVDIKLPQVKFIMPTEDEVAKFRADMKEMAALLERTREYDKRTNQPDCESSEKKRILKELADSMGVDISFIEK